MTFHISGHTYVIPSITQKDTDVSKSPTEVAIPISLSLRRHKMPAARSDRLWSISERLDQLEIQNVPENTKEAVHESQSSRKRKLDEDQPPDQSTNPVKILEHLTKHKGNLKSDDAFEFTDKLQQVVDYFRQLGLGLVTDKTEG
ncbi:uncharacterized protein [Antedon mediterranea]|uniref:uncharacterized protein n=1 Tax=Antedon mediterranea TaxID=105859 RepID=UPI003AF520DA